jgi:hypothetical protein
MCICAHPSTWTSYRKYRHVLAHCSSWDKAVLCCKKPPSFKNSEPIFSPAVQLTSFQRSLKVLSPSFYTGHAPTENNFQHTTEVILKNTLCCENCLSVPAKNVECKHTLTFSFPTNNNSTDLDLETLKAIVHELTVVYQNTSSSTCMEKSALSLDTAILEDLYIFCSH